MKPSLDIVSVGMVTAVGLDAASSCAAMRARLDGFRETNFKSMKGNLIGAPIPLPRNWIGERRLVQIAGAAALEALASTPEARESMAVFLCLLEQERPGRPIRNAEHFAGDVIRVARLDAAQGARVVAHGRPSGFVALADARQLLAKDDTEFVLILGVDSYLTSAAVGAFVNRNRLLTSDNANGFIPGEAAAAVLCRRSTSRGLGVYGLGFAREPAAIYNAENRPLRGDGMTEAYRTALSETGIEMNRIGYRIADLIGEQYWFKQSALASLRLLRGRHDFQDIWSPAESLGNVGAAVVPAMIAMAFEAAKKGYAGGNPVLLEASNDAGTCGAAVLGLRGAG